MYLEEKNFYVFQAFDNNESLPNLWGGEVEGSCYEVILPGQAGRVRQAKLNPTACARHPQLGWVHLEKSLYGRYLSLHY